MTEYEQRVDAFARQWMTEHPERLASWLSRKAQVDNGRPITLFQRFEHAREWSDVTYDPATFEIGFLVPILPGTPAGGAVSVSMQYDADEIDVGVILRGVLAVDVDKWGKVAL